ARDLIGPSGTLMLDFATDKMRRSKYPMRTLLMLHTASRLLIGIRTFQNNPCCQFTFYDQTNNFYFGSEKLKPDTPYKAALTWDGDKVRCYFQGRLIKESPQPVQLDSKLITNLTIGPMESAYHSVPPWDNDTYCGRIRIFKEALSADEIADFSAVKAAPIRERYPRIIAVPKLQGNIKLDAALEDEGWQNAAGIVSLTEGNRNYNGSPTWNLPPHHVYFTWDDAALFFSMDTTFPPGSSIKKGHGPDDKESGVWQNESFELHLRHNGRKYYFAGCVAGGKADMRDTDGTYNPEWKYVSHLSHQIDDTLLWRVEARIPWKALELDAAPKELKLNFVRSWFSSALSATSDLANQPEKGYWADDEWLYALRFADNAPTLRTIDHNDPSYGELVQKLQLTSAIDCKVRLRIIQEHSSGLLAPQDVFAQTVDLNANAPRMIDVSVPLTIEQADRLIYELCDLDGNAVALRQDLPLTIKAEYITASPRFTAETVDVKIKQAILKRKFGEDFSGEIALIAPDGKPLLTEPMGDKPIKELHFPKNNPIGHYRIELRAPEGKVVSGTSLHFPGFGEWSRMDFDMTRIIPPYQPMKTVAQNGVLTVEPVGRSYQWEFANLLPRQIVTKGQSLFMEPPQIFSNGQPLHIPIKPGSIEKHRVDFTADSKSTLCDIAAHGWLEYDGVQHNEVEIKALQQIKDIELKFTLPRKVAKYLHTSQCGWSSKITMALPDGEFACRYFPVAIIGNEDKCFCFFAESNASWSERRPKPLSFVSDKEKTVFTVHIADVLNAGDKLSFDFGLLAGPVKPLATNHPLDTAGEHWAFPMNRPGRAPATWCGYMRGNPALSDAFADLPTAKDNPIAAKYLADAKEAIAFNVHPFIYTANYMSDEYPEVRAFLSEWVLTPEQQWSGKRGNAQYTMYMLCPASDGANFVLSEIKSVLGKAPLHGLNFDFGIVPICDNHLHGCRQRTPLLAYRNFFRKVAMLLLDAGVKDYVIHIHNTSSVQLPCYTFATHLINGEHIRQQSSTLMHNGKDILDTYKLPMFAFELSSLPFGIYNAAYQSNDILRKEFGGGKEDPELYKLRITRAFLTGMLPHNGINALDRCHFGIFDKITRIYEDFDVPGSLFTGYWDAQNPAKVITGKDVYASCYRNRKGELLAVVSHLGNERLTQDVTIAFSGKAFKTAVELIDADDPEYKELYQMREKYNIPTFRVPLDWQPAGVKVLDFKDNTLKLHLPYHTFALVRLSE
ncbi:MAG: hypothetical protein IKS20_11180, partial [Victivallales bacterium]|nr:hypothetical protein [Victivallales bacterium]